MIKYTLASVLICILIISCKKEVSGEQSNIQGNYKFISVTAHTKSATSTTIGPDTEEAVTYSDYVTKDNSGTIKIDASNLTTQDISYTIDTIMTSILSTNGVVTDTMQLPFQFNTPASSGTSPYKMVTSDSIYLSSGTTFMSGTTQATMPIGAKIKIDGDKLYMTISSTQSSTQIVQGVSASVYSEVNGTIIMQKM